MSEKLRGAVIEIVERTDELDPDFIVPTEVRINGQLLAVTDDRPVIVEKIQVDGSSLVQVTLTVLARRVVMGAEPRGKVIRDAAGNVVRIVKDPA